MKHQGLLRSFTLISLGALGALQGRAASLLDLDIDALSQLDVRSATGFKMPAREAPAIVSIVTASQIEAMGARTLEEALTGVAGLHISPKNRQPLFVIRGMYTFDNPQVLVTLNDVPINQVFTGALGAGVRLPLAGVERIEVVRGPGSAVFGADAFAGVINIVTRDPMREPETAAGVSAGAFNSAGLWARKTSKFADWGLMLSAEVQRSDGDRARRIPADQQTEFDGIFGSQASLAPGALDTQYRLSNVHVELARADLQLRLWHYRADKMGAAWGIAGALDPSSQSEARQSLAELRWQLPGGSDALRSVLRASWGQHWFDANYRVFPAGAVLPVNTRGELFGAGESSLFTFKDGAIGNPGSEENSYRLDWESQYLGWDGHRLRLAFGVNRQDFHAWESKNFSNGGPVGILVDVTGTPAVYAPDLSRSTRYMSLQDVWRLNDAAEVTLGLRADRFSDFGTTINPRASLVWRHAPELVSKWLYGSAFRAPSMKEQFVASNPVNIGSKTLRPEKVDTLEWQIDWTAGPTFNPRLALFYYEMKDLIRLVQGTYKNVGELSAPGVELELDWRATESSRLAFNYAYQRAKDGNGDPAPFAPRHSLSLSLDQRLLPSLTANGQARWVGDRPRPAGVTKSPLPAYALLDLGLRWQAPGEPWSCSMGLKNALNARATEPLDSQAIPGDAPMPGREWRLDFRMAF
ncbi:TonB-dependent receptor plug domain-containing protein [Roseateles albus]|uniref:TonB-dependent receptor n=1 Tax=Roseateles albus TaxID=2987525 RepID=A0ABT5KIH4_9BURK|nr:TonB-dependent receptor [Roseateles albus]MDC8773739.1 TonB-dependent receptor [Roseateles albus]